MAETLGDKHHRKQNGKLGHTPIGIRESNLLGLHAYSHPNNPVIGPPDSLLQPIDQKPFYRIDRKLVGKSMIDLGYSLDHSLCDTRRFPQESDRSDVDYD
jgi:hypothetical protein